MSGTSISAVPVLGAVIKLFRDSSPLRKALLVLGGTTFVIGVALLAFGVYNLVDGGDSRPTPAIRNLSGTATPKPATASPTPLRTPILGDQPYNLVIERLGVDAPVNEFGLDANSIPQVPTGPDAAQIVAWYDFSAKPGLGSNAVFAGHVTWNGRAVFYDLPSIAAGDVVKLRGTTGTEVVYKISQVFSVDP